VLELIALVREQLARGLVSLTDQAGTSSYTYDTLGRLATETRTLMGTGGSAVSKNLSYEYNLGLGGSGFTHTPGSIRRGSAAARDRKGS
jgi:YD repeat-containing protein